MKRATRLLFLPALFLAAAHATAGAQSSGPHTIKGTVHVRGGKPPHIEVVLENSTRMPLARVLADQDGRYAFYGLGFGTYRVVVPPFGEYSQVTQEVEIFGSPDSIIIRTVDLQLQPKAKGGAGGPATVSAFTQPIPKQAEEAYDRGVSALEQGSTESGVAHLKRALELFPDYHSALVRLGTENARTGHYDKAAQLFRRACEVNPKSATSHVMLGISLVELGQYREAIPALTLGKSLDPKSVNAHLYLGLAQLETDDATRAEGSLRRAYELGGPSRAAVARLHLASIYDRQGKYREAADELEGYLRDVPGAKNSAKIREVIERLRRKGKG
jgi:tetratricopeptide (TPR) repeat protein